MAAVHKMAMEAIHINDFLEKGKLVLFTLYRWHQGKGNMPDRSIIQKILAYCLNILHSKSHREVRYII